MEGCKQVVRVGHYFDFSFLYKHFFDVIHQFCCKTFQVEVCSRLADFVCKLNMFLPYLKNIHFEPKDHFVNIFSNMRLHPQTRHRAARVQRSVFV